MQIKELSQHTGLPDKTIRYYEEIGVLPPPSRLPNGYRDYDKTDVERVKFVMGARRLDFSLGDISEILAMRDRREAPCWVVLDLMQRKADEIAQRIAELQRLENELHALHALGLTFPTDDVEGKDCVCHLVREGAGQII
ncbi:MAG: heavy metal-responsive transcriptional regulator [Anaerolineales bacterium]